MTRHEILWQRHVGWLVGLFPAWWIQQRVMGCREVDLQEERLLVLSLHKLNCRIRERAFDIGSQPNSLFWKQLAFVGLEHPAAIAGHLAPGGIILRLFGTLAG